MLDHALQLAQRGWPVFPLRPYSKRPAIRNWEQQATTDPVQVRAWWSADPTANIGLACGPAGLVVIDLDSGHDAGREHGRHTLARLAVAAGGEPIPWTYTVATPSGEHLYFVAPPGSHFRNTVAVLGPHIDTRVAGGYVVAAGSKVGAVDNARPYRVTQDMSAMPLPAWLTATLEPVRVAATEQPGRARLGEDRAHAYTTAAVTAEARAVALATPGRRNQTLFRAAANLGQLVGAGLLDEAAATAALLTAAQRHSGVEGFTPAEACRTVTNGIRHGRRNPRRLTA
jgi:Bifunctional DNA primase/polymerase, N-terminal